MAIAGYTNAGKSSLLNALTGAGVLVEDALFATLDPTIRRAVTADGRAYTLTDTVGFVRHLPHQLVEAFRSTLEEVAGADLLVHVVDAADPLPEDQIKAVRQVLVEIGEEHGGRMPPSCWWSTRSTPPATWPWPGCGTCCPARCSSPRSGATASRGCAPGSPSCCPSPELDVELLLPYTRGGARLPGARRGRGARRGAHRRGHAPARPGRGRARGGGAAVRPRRQRDAGRGPLTVLC